MSRGLFRTAVSFSGFRWRGTATGRLRSLPRAPGFSDRADYAIERVDGSGKDSLDAHCPSVTGALV